MITEELGMMYQGMMTGKLSDRTQFKKVLHQWARTTTTCAVKYKIFFYLSDSFKVRFDNTTNNNFIYGSEKI